MTKPKTNYRINVRRRSGHEIYIYGIQTLVDEETYTILRKAAKSKKLSLSAYTRNILEEHIKNNDIISFIYNHKSEPIACPTHSFSYKKTCRMCGDAMSRTD
jgi:hypothetical protein